MGVQDFKDTDALAFEAGGAQAEGHNPLYTGKRKRTSKGLEIVFDQDQHREYVTGFHKRKMERRKKAQKQKAEKDRKERLEEKAERRAKLREELDLERYETPSDSEGDEGAAGVGGGVTVYKANNAVTTVTVAPLILNSEEEPEESGDDSDERTDVDESIKPGKLGGGKKAEQQQKVAIKVKGEGSASQFRSGKKRKKQKRGKGR